MWRSARKIVIPVWTPDARVVDEEEDLASFEGERVEEMRERRAGEQSDHRQAVDQHRKIHVVDPPIHEYGNLG